MNTSISLTKRPTRIPSTIRENTVYREKENQEMNKILEQLKEYGVVPVVVLDNVKDALPLGKALCDGGLPCAEVTFRTDAAEESIR